MAFPSTFYVLLRNQQYLTVVGATVETYTDKTIYDTQTYRNELPSGYLGRAWGATAAKPFVSPGSPESTDDRFTATAPAFLAKKRTLIVWTDGSGNTVGECWADQFVGISSSVPRFVGG